MKRKGYISIFALFVGLLLFTVLTFMILSIRSHNQISSHQLLSEQLKLDGESITAFLLDDEILMKFFRDVIENNEPKDSGYRIINFNEIRPENIRIDYAKVSDSEIKLSYTITENKSAIIYNTHLRLKEIPDPNFEGEEAVQILSLSEIEAMLSDVQKDSLNSIEGNKVIFSEEGKNYTIDKENFDQITNEFIDTADNEEDYWTKIIESSTALDGDVFFDGESLLFTGREEIVLSGIIVNRANITHNTATLLKGVYFNLNNSIQEDLSIQGRLFGMGNTPEVVFDPQEMDKFKAFFPGEKELKFLYSYIY